MYVIRALSTAALLAISSAQTLTGIYTVTPQDIALGSNNISTNENTPFQVYQDAFLQILGPNPNITLVVNASLPYYHEAGVVTSENPLTLFSTSNQFNASGASPAMNGKTIVLTRTVQDNVTGQWMHEVVNNNTSPLLLANGGFPYRNGIIFDTQGTLDEPGGLVYLPTDDPNANLSISYTVVDNYLGKQFNSPNDVYVTRNGVIYFTDPTIGYLQKIRPTPSLPNQVYAFVPNTTIIKPIADHFGNPNGITFSPDERTVYISDTDIAGGLATGNFTSYRTIYAYDVQYSSTRGNSSAEPAQGEVAFFSNRRVFAMPSQGLPDGLKCDTNGNLYVGAGDGIDVYNPQGILLGKIVVQGGVSNFGFASDGRILAMNEKRLWLVRLNPDVQPAIAVGERRG